MQLQGQPMIQTQQNREKPHFGPLIFLLKNMASSVTRYQGHLSSCAISEKKLMIQT